MPLDFDDLIAKISQLAPRRKPYSSHPPLYYQVRQLESKAREIKTAHQKKNTQINFSTWYNDLQRSYESLLKIKGLLPEILALNENKLPQPLNEIVKTFKKVTNDQSSSDDGENCSLWDFNPRYEQYEVVYNGIQDLVFLIDQAQTLDQQLTCTTFQHHLVYACQSPIFNLSLRLNAIDKDAFANELILIHTFLLTWMIKKRLAMHEIFSERLNLQALDTIAEQAKSPGGSLDCKEYKNPYLLVRTVHENLQNAEPELKKIDQIQLRLKSFFSINIMANKPSGFFPPNIGILNLNLRNFSAKAMTAWEWLERIDNQFYKLDLIAEEFKGFKNYEAHFKAIAIAKLRKKLIPYTKLTPKECYAGLKDELTEFTETEYYKILATNHSWQQAYAKLMNILLWFPFIGWSCLGVRYCIYGSRHAFFDTRTTQDLVGEVFQNIKMIKSP